MNLYPLSEDAGVHGNVYRLVVLNIELQQGFLDIAALVHPNAPRYISISPKSNISNVIMSLSLMHLTFIFTSEKQIIYIQ
jgi:hypothetical protein